MDAVADGNNVHAPKPAPDVFLKAAALLGVPPAFCAVVEDAGAGIDAALAAGMWAVGVGPAARVGPRRRPFRQPRRRHPRRTPFCVRGGGLDGRRQPASTRRASTTWRRSSPAATAPCACVARSRKAIPAIARVLHAPRLGRHARQLHRARQSAGMVGRRAGGGRRAIPAGPRARCSRYRRSLDLRTGVLSRTVRWQAGAATGPCWTSLRALHQPGGPAPRGRAAGGRRGLRARPTSADTSGLERGTWRTPGCCTGTRSIRTVDGGERWLLHVRTRRPARGGRCRRGQPADCPTSRAMRPHRPRRRQ